MVERVVRDAVGGMRELNGRAVDMVLVHGDGVGVSGVREGLERVFGEAMVGEAFGDEGNDEAVFAGADGTARIAYELVEEAPRQEAALGCRFMSGLYEDGWRGLWTDAVQLTYWGRG